MVEETDGVRSNAEHSRQPTLEKEGTTHTNPLVSAIRYHSRAKLRPPFTTYGRCADWSYHYLLS